MKKFLILAALFGVTFAELAKFTKCAGYTDDICEVTAVRVNPCKERDYCALKKGQESSIQFDFIPKFDADKLTSTLFWASPGGDLPFDQFTDVDACQYTPCGTQSGAKQELNYSLRLGPKLPTGRYKFKWTLWDAADKTKKCCFMTDVKLKK